MWGDFITNCVVGNRGKTLVFDNDTAEPARVEVHFLSDEEWTEAGHKSKAFGVHMPVGNEEFEGEFYRTLSIIDVRSKAGDVDISVPPDGTPTEMGWFFSWSFEAVPEVRLGNNTVTVDYRSLITHEIGHFFGLPHPLGNLDPCCDVATEVPTMYSSTDAGKAYTECFHSGLIEPHYLLDDLSPSEANWLDVKYSLDNWPWQDNQNVLGEPFCSTTPVELQIRGVVVGSDGTLKIQTSCASEIRWGSLYLSGSEAGRCE